MPPGILVLVDLHVDQGGDAALIVAALAHLLPVFGDLEEQVEVETGVVARLLEGGHDHLDGRLGVAEGQRCARGVDDVGARLGTLDVVGGGHAADVVTVQVDGQPGSLAQGAGKAVCAVGREQAGHVLDADRVGSELLEGHRIVDVAVEGVHGARGIGDGALEIGPALLDGPGAVLDVSDVVQGVEDAEHVDAVAVGGRDEAVHDIGRVVVVTHQVLPAHQHGQGRTRTVLLDGTETLPRVLVKEPQAGVERRTAPCLDGPIADLVHLRQDGKHVADGHARRPERLLPVANRGIHNLQGLHQHLPESATW